MNLPNKLTILRIIMIPVFVAFFFIDAIPYNLLISAIIFVLAAFTDFLDGYIARKQNLVTNFGKFFDPIADKALVLTALVILLAKQNIMPFYASIAVSLIIVREILISGLRMFVASKGIVLPADKVGKIKTVFQDFAIIVLLVGGAFFPETYSAMNIVGLSLLLVATVLTVVSGGLYLYKNRSVFSDTDDTKQDQEK